MELYAFSDNYFTTASGWINYFTVEEIALFFELIDAYELYTALISSEIFSFSVNF